MHDLHAPVTESAILYFNDVLLILFTNRSRWSIFEVDELPRCLLMLVQFLYLLPFLKHNYVVDVPINWFTKHSLWIISDIVVNVLLFLFMDFHYGS